MRKIFYMMRHGETVANEQGYAAGSLDSPLTERGRNQAFAMEPAIFNLKKEISYVVHSHLSRARDTAKIINQRLGAPMHSNNDLAEQCFGDWRGMNWADMRELMEDGLNPPNGESVGDFYVRAIKGIEHSLALLSGTPLIVTHGGIFDGFFYKNNLKRISIKNCALYKFTPSLDSLSWDVEKIDTQAYAACA